MYMCISICKYISQSHIILYIRGVFSLNAQNNLLKYIDFFSKKYEGFVILCIRGETAAT